MNTPHWHILGSGAIGCLFGTALQRSGYPVTLIQRERQEHSMATVTLKTRAQSEEFQMRVFSHEKPDAISHLLVTTKAYDVRTAVASITQHLAANCQVLLLTNGMGVAEQLSADHPQLQIYCGTTTEGAYRVSALHIAHTGRGETCIGREGQVNPASWFEQWSTAVEHCRWDSQITASMWSKLAVNSVINPLSAAHRCPNGDLARRADLATQVSLLCEEAVAISRAAGFVETAAALPQTVAKVIAATATNRSSMLQDIERGQRTEIDWITGYLLQVAQRCNVDAPHHRALFEKIQHHAH